MKIHQKKKVYREWVKEQARAGKINRNDGTFVTRASLPESSMRRDYMPNQGGGQ